ncbi:unnamed protein product [Phaedon cochleariae]|uniref:Uncharacterized protein n=1 Tax=Phaedon cochleariae TaxID=80249 RepID=A0A9N9S894_PHACE|nr:unnamed protein product [Phaedon cochleariae]
MKYHYGTAMRPYQCKMYFNTITLEDSASTDLVYDQLSTNEEPQTSSKVSSEEITNISDEKSSHTVNNDDILSQKRGTTNISIYIDDFENDHWNQMDMIYCTMCFSIWIILLSFYLPISNVTIYLLVTALIGVYLNVSAMSLKKEVSVITENCKCQSKQSTDTIIII